MLHFLRGPILGVLAALLVVLNTMFWVPPFYLFGVIRTLPIPGLRDRCAHLLMRMGECWIGGNNAVISLTQKIEWDIRGVDDLDRDGWYMISSNHRSWADIVVLQKAFHRRAPFLKFFLKQELIWVPLLGLCWWALDYPFMKRLSKDYLKKHPEKRGSDIEATRRACERYKNTPVAILNFLEGTRFTEEKHARQKSPYRNLLRAKAGGLAFALAAMGAQLQTMLDVTLVYPDQPGSFWDFLCGRVRKVIVHVEQRPIPAEMIGGDYMNDPNFRRHFHEWVTRMWEEKDATYERLLQEERARTVETTA